MVSLTENRIATIVKEINYWKEHNLLPNVYCDFLLALYTNGEDQIETEPSTKSHKKFKPTTFIQIILLLLLIPFSFLVIYFTQFSMVLQISTLLFFIGYSFWMYQNFRKDKDMYYHLSLIVLLFLLLLTTMFLTGLLWNSDWVIAILLLIHFVSWFIISKKNNIKYLKITSVFGIIFTIFYIVL
ncbi:hypothetical protein ACFQ3N_08885 [Virgibacillus byunsanensis]|uniref:DUF1129 family protein n=1 Tax=Virgibacillus byunsanensis TaxID=570945 RepID=A0ABW3LJD4_9BACI